VSRAGLRLRTLVTVSGIFIDALPATNCCPLGSGRETGNSVNGKRVAARPLRLSFINAALMRIRRFVWTGQIWPPPGVLGNHFGGYCDDCHATHHKARSKRLSQTLKRASFR
jgi:hypothetical protein